MPDRYTPSEEARRLPLVAALDRHGVSANEAAEVLAQRVADLEREVTRLRLYERVERVVIKGDTTETTIRSHPPIG